ncbi:MAG: RnfH family protein [Magnetococcales bacterium]|nr:RnfH family protein [Magnetococcales bacterium]MBF0151919.1 RnfH family protein [Magnetococcales bacterium]
MKVAVAYAEAQKQWMLDVEVQEGVTAAEVVERSGILKKVPQINLGSNKIGIFGKIVEPDHVVAVGDRLEIYRPAMGKPPKKERAAKDAEVDEESQATGKPPKKERVAKEAEVDEKPQATEGAASKADKVAAAKQRAALAKARLAEKQS